MLPKITKEAVILFLKEIISFLLRRNKKKEEEEIDEIVKDIKVGGSTARANKRYRNRDSD